MSASTIPRRQDAVNHPATLHDVRTSAGDAFSELWVAVFQLGGLFTAAGDALSKPAGQTSARWQVMAAIEDGPATVAQIARRLHLARQSVQRIADLLAADGIAAYEDNPGHRRAKLLRLTPAGVDALRTIQAAQRSWANTLGARVGERDLRRATKVLRRVLDALVSTPVGRQSARPTSGVER
jgi:DNA-binding MarR family transcriptional regulator